MKKIITLLTISLFLTGCTTIKISDSQYENKTRNSDDSQSQLLSTSTPTTTIVATNDPSTSSVVFNKQIPSGQKVSTPKPPTQIKKEDLSKTVDSSIPKIENNLIITDNTNNITQYLQNQTRTLFKSQFSTLLQIFSELIDLERFSNDYAIKTYDQRKESLDYQNQKCLTDKNQEIERINSNSIYNNPNYRSALNPDQSAKDYMLQKAETNYQSCLTLNKNLYFVPEQSFRNTLTNWQVKITQTLSSIAKYGNNGDFTSAINLMTSLINESESVNEMRKVLYPGPGSYNNLLQNINNQLKISSEALKDSSNITCEPNYNFNGGLPSGYNCGSFLCSIASNGKISCYKNPLSH